MSELHFLGHHVDKHGIHPLPEKVAAIQEFPQPASLKKLRGFLGLVNFYRRFIPGFARILAPLNDLLCEHNHRPHKQLAWTPICDQAFKDIKTALANATLLVHPDSTLPFSIMVDASDTAVGGVLQQGTDGSWQTIAFFSQRLKPAETKYSTFGRELPVLAVYLTSNTFMKKI